MLGSVFFMCYCALAHTPAQITNGYTDGYTDSRMVSINLKISSGGSRLYKMP